MPAGYISPTPEVMGVFEELLPEDLYLEVVAEDTSRRLGGSAEAVLKTHDVVFEFSKRFTWHDAPGGQDHYQRIRACIGGCVHASKDIKVFPVWIVFRFKIAARGMGAKIINARRGGHGEGRLR